MGDRGNIKLKERNGNSIYVYAHWHGSELPTILQEALKDGKEQWTDDSYLQRFIITRTCKSAGHDDVTGFGVSTSRTDNEHNILEVDVENQKVRVLSDERWHEKDFDWAKSPEVLQEWTFEEYIALAEPPSI